MGASFGVTEGRHDKQFHPPQFMNVTKLAAHLDQARKDHATASRDAVLAAAAHRRATSVHRQARKKLKAARKSAKTAKKAVRDTRERAKLSARLALKRQGLLKKLTKKVSVLKPTKSARPAAKTRASRQVVPLRSLTPLANPRPVG